MNFRAYLDGAEIRRSNQTFGNNRVVFNKFVEDRERLRALGLHKLVPFDHSQKAVTTMLKRTDGFEFLRESSAVAQQQAVRDARVAYKNWFDSLSGRRKGGSMGRPRFRKRSHRQAARFSRAERFVVLDTPTGSRWGKVHIPSIGTIRYRKTRELPSDPSSVTLISNPDGTWEVSFVVDAPAPAAVAPIEDSTRFASVDVGLTTLGAVASIDTDTGDATREAIENPRFLRAGLRKLKRQQRAKSRSQHNSKNQIKKRVKVAKTHAKVAARRDAHHRQQAHTLVSNHDVIAVETLTLKGMGRTRLAKSVYDTGLGKFLAYIDLFAESQGKLVVKIGRWEPTTQTCSCCGAPGGKKPLSVRVWTCESCGVLLDRDFNAAVNILVAAGLAETLNACGPGVRRLLASAVGATPDPSGKNQVSTEAETAEQSAA